MAKVIWWLSVIIAALINGVAPYHMEEIPFVEGNYYGRDLVGIDDPAALYNSFFAPQSNQYEPCIPANMVFNTTYGKLWSVGNSQRTYFLPVPGDMAESAMYTYEIPEGTILPILAPLNCTIKTALQESVNSTKMEVKLEINGYTIIFTDLNHWYCCHGHKQVLSRGFKHFRVTDADFASRVIKQGEILGFADERTMITILDDKGEQISFGTFYQLEDADKFKTTLDEMYVPPEEQTSSTESVSEQ